MDDRARSEFGDEYTRTQLYMIVQDQQEADEHNINLKKEEALNLAKSNVMAQVSRHGSNMDASEGKSSDTALVKKKNPEGDDDKFKSPEKDDKSDA